MLGNHFQLGIFLHILRCNMGRADQDSFTALQLLCHVFCSASLHHLEVLLKKGNGIGVNPFS